MNKGIYHNQKQQRFQIELEGQISYISYLLHNGSIEYNHTIVPKALGGQGLGTELVKYGLAYARINHLLVIPSCPFVADLMKKYVVYQDLLFNG